MSLEVQRDRCDACAQEHGYAVVAMFEDRCSGAYLDRPGLSNLRELVQSGAVDVVIVTSADRLTRQLADLAQLRAELEQAGVTIVTVNEAAPVETGVSHFTWRLETAIARFQRDHLVQRLAHGRETARALRLAAANNASNPATIHRVFELYTARDSEGPLTATQIVEQLNHEGATQPLRVAIYARAAAHASVTSQLSTLRAAADAAGWSVTRTITDRSAGGSLDRQELQALRDAARAGAIDLVLVVSLDRLARRVRDVAALRAELVAAGCAIVVLAQDATWVAPMGMTLDTPDEAAA